MDAGKARPSHSHRGMQAVERGKAEDERMEQYLPTDKELLREMRRVRRKNKRKRLAWGLLIWSAIAAAAGWFVFNRYYTLAVVQGPGMSPAAESGSVVLCRRLETGQKPKQGDIVLFGQGKEWQLKRVAAVGGDQVALSSKGNLWINGAALKDYTGGGMDADLLQSPLTVPEGELFVLGDNYALSVDSRSSAFGTVPAEDVAGVVRCTLWPLYKLSNPFR